MKRESQVTDQSFYTSKKVRSYRFPKIIRLVGIKNLISLAALAGLVSTTFLYGTPHILFQYSYVGHKSRMTDCTYVGLNSQTVDAAGTNCPIIRLLKEPR